MDERFQDDLEKNNFQSSQEDEIKPLLGKNLKEVVDHFSKNKGIRQEETLNMLSELLASGRYKLVDPQPPTTIRQFFFSMYNLKFWSIVSFLGISIVSIYRLPQVYPFIFLKYLCVSVLLLFLPGFSSVSAFFPISKKLDEIENMALSIGMSLAITPLVGVILNYTVWGLTLDAIISGMLIMILILSLISAVRGYSYWKINSG